MLLSLIILCSHSTFYYLTKNVLCRIGLAQPDNREEKQNGAAENCLALLNNFYGDGIHWHDVACHHRKPFVCEENEALLKWVRFNNPELRV